VYILLLIYIVNWQHIFVSNVSSFMLRNEKPNRY